MKIFIAISCIITVFLARLRNNCTTVIHYIHYGWGCPSSRGMYMHGIRKLFGKTCERTVKSPLMESRYLSCSTKTSDILASTTHHAKLNLDSSDKIIFYLLVVFQLQVFVAFPIFSGDNENIFTAIFECDSFPYRQNRYRLKISPRWERRK